MEESSESAPAAVVKRRITSGGPLPFAELMEEALYGEGGYYNRVELPIGERGDFVTGSAYSDLFGRATARLLSRLDVVLGEPAALIDAGCGNGRHLAAVAASSVGRHLYGWDRIARPLPPGAKRLQSALPSSRAEVSEVGRSALSSRAEVSEASRSREIPPRRDSPINGVVFSYELFDALPVHRLVGLEDGSVGELLVGLDAAGRLEWQRGELSDPALASLLGSHRLEPGQVADLSPGWVPLYRYLASLLGRGLLVTFDYGYERPQLLDPRIRRHGTLACYRSHHVHRDALRDLGEQDLTAHVDFTALREAGEAAGLHTVTLTRQARWLTALGLFDDLDGEVALALRQQAAVLLDPEGMGDQIRVLVQAREVDASALVDLSIVGC